MYSLLTDNQSSWSLEDVPGRVTEEVPWTSDTRQGAVLVLQSHLDQKFRAYLLRESRVVAKCEGPLSAYDDFTDTVNLWWANSGARGSFLWQTQPLGGSLPGEPPDPDPIAPPDGATLGILAVESNAAMVQETFLDTLGLVCGAEYDCEE